MRFGGLVLAVLLAAAAPAAAAAPPYGSLQRWVDDAATPPFVDPVRVADFKPALEAAMAFEDVAVQRIVRDRAAPTFANTVEALERAGRPLSRVRGIYNVWKTTLSTPELRAVEKEMDPRLAAHSGAVDQDPALFRRLRAVYADRSRLTPEQQRLAWLYWDNARRAGAELPEPARARVAVINTELAGLYTRFSQNLLADENKATFFANAAELAGLPAAELASAAAAAEARGRKGAWAIVNTRSAVEPVLTYAADRGVRERIWRTFSRRGDNGDETDNNGVIKRILALRAERAKLFGQPDHAHWRLGNTMAKTPEAATELMMKAWPATVARIREEVADMQALAGAEGAQLRIEPWDYRYYAEKVRKARFDLDQNEVRAYLQLDRLRDGMFWAAREVYGLSFESAADLPVAHPDVAAYRVRGADGTLVGLFYHDPYARPGKRGGVWMSAYRNQARLDGRAIPAVANVQNFTKGAAGRPVTISWADAIALFHEFGHSLHALNSNVTYPSLAGTQGPRDYAEFPSQLNEHWLRTPEVLSKFALHVETGQPMPPALLERIRRAMTFNQGFGLGEYLVGALIDMRLHLADPATLDLAAFEAEEMKRLGAPREVPMRHRLTQFYHLFDGESYSAGYYSYLWSETLSADAAEAFAEAGGLYDKATAARLKATIMSVGNAVDPEAAYRNFRGRAPGVEAVLRDRGLTPRAP